MRTKAVPMDEPSGEGVTGKIESLFKNKWVLYGTIGAVALVGGYFVLQSQSQAAPSSSDGSGGVAYGQPVGYGASGGPIASGGGGTDGSGSSDALAAAIQAQTANDQATQQANLAAIRASADAAIAGDYANIDLANINGTVANYANSTALASQFIKSTGGNLISIGGSISPTTGGGLNIGLFTANQKQPLDYGNILHQVANNAGATPAGANPLNPPFVNLTPGK